MAKKRTPPLIHYFETRQERARRLGLHEDDVMAQAICSTGDVRRKVTKDKKLVTCEACLKELKKSK